MNIVNNQWPYLIIFERLFLALAVGLFIGLERQRREKGAGVRTFSIAAVMGVLGGLLGEVYAAISLLLIGIIVVIMNIEAIRANKEAELTTSIALAITTFMGILCGLGHTFTPVAVGVITAALLAWKQPLTNFSIRLTEAEIRSAILLAILTFIIYPVLPKGTVDPWGVVDLQAAWITVILIAGIGFINYILLKAYEDRGNEISGFLGGLVNSDVAARELARRSHDMLGHLSDSAYRGILFTNTGMIIRNAVLLAILDYRALFVSMPAFIMMLVATVIITFVRRKPHIPPETERTGAVINLSSPFSLKSVLMFGVLLLVIQVVGVVAQRLAGQAGVYVTSFVGSLFSSTSTVAAVATLAKQGGITSQVAGICAVIASLTSDLGTIPYLLGVVERKSLIRVIRATVIIAIVGAVTTGITLMFFTG